MAMAPEHQDEVSLVLSPDDELTAAAERALELVQSRPHEAAAAAHRVVARAIEANDHAAAALGERALGLAALETQDGERALRHLRAAARLADQTERDDLIGVARMSLSLALARGGQTEEALREVDVAAAHLPSGVEAARVRVQRALILQQQGKFDQAAEHYRQSLAGLRAAGDRLWEARTRCNLGVLHTYLGEWEKATNDLMAAERLFAELGQELGIAGVRHNRGFIAARRGDLPAALQFFDEADAHYRSLGVPRAVLLLDRCDVLLAAGLTTEARVAADHAVAELSGSGLAHALAEARLTLARAALTDGDLMVARREARLAAAAFARQQRPVWQALAAAALLEADVAAAEAAPSGGEGRLPEAALSADGAASGSTAVSGRGAATRNDHPEALLSRATELAGVLEGAGWTHASLDMRLTAARLAARVGRAEVAAGQLAAASAARDGGPVGVQVRAWHALALLQRERGDRMAAHAAVAAGLDRLARHRAALGATEMRAAAASHGEALGRLGLRLALEEGDPERVVAASEAVRATTLGVQPLRPPDDVALAADLAALRRTTAELEQARLHGAATRELEQRQVELERSISDRCRRAPCEELLMPPEPPVLADLAEQLGQRVMVMYLAVDSFVHSVTVADGQARLHAPVGRAELERRAGTLAFGLRRQVWRAGTRGAAAAARLARDVAAELDDVLFGAVREEIAERPLVIVPSAALRHLPWSALATCRERAVSVAPSAALWHRAQQRAADWRTSRRRTLLAAGPRLPGAGEEVADLAALYGGRGRVPVTEERRRRDGSWQRGDVQPACLAGGDATVGAVAAALGVCDHAHVAAHGRFRADNPLFSSLELADGPLTVHDLERLPQAPALLTLSSCDAARSAVPAGEELLGLAAALFALGTGTLVASPLPVPDAATRTFMVAYHRRLLAGDAPAAALCGARGDVRDDDAATLAGGTFVCFGAG